MAKGKENQLLIVLRFFGLPRIFVTLCYLRKYGVKISPPEEVVPENLDSVGRVVAHASSRMELPNFGSS